MDRLDPPEIILRPILSNRNRNLGVEPVKNGLPLEERRSPDFESYQFEEGSPSPSRYLMRSPSPFDRLTRSLTPIPRPAQYTNPEFREKILRERGVWDPNKCYNERPPSNSSQSTTDSGWTMASSSESASARSHSSKRSSSSYEESSHYATRMPFGRQSQNKLPFERFLEREVRIKKEDDQREIRIKKEEDEREVRIKKEEDEREIRIKKEKDLSLREPTYNDRYLSRSWRNEDLAPDKEEMDEDEDDEEEDEVPRSKKMDFYCEVCDIHVSSMQGLQDHFAGARHLKKLRASGLTSDLTELGKDIYTTADPTLKKRILRCKLCDVIFSGSEMAVHVNATKHKSALDEFEEPPDKADPFWFEDIGLSNEALQQQEQDREGYYCDLCGCTLPSRELFQKHLQGKKHQKRLKWTEGEDLPEGGQQFWCQICNIFCTNQESLDAHLAGKKHAKVLKSKGLVDSEEPAQPTTQDDKRQQSHVSQYLPPQVNSQGRRKSPLRRSRSPSRRSKTPSRRSRSPPKHHRSSSRYSRSPPRYHRNHRRSRSPSRSLRRSSRHSRSPPSRSRHSKSPPTRSRHSKSPPSSSRHSKSPPARSRSPRSSHRPKDSNSSQGSAILGGLMGDNSRVQCTLCKIMLYSNSEIHSHLASSEHIDAIIRNPHLKLQDFLVSGSATSKRR